MTSSSLTATPMSVLIAGCGDLGALLGAELTSVGHHVLGLRRSPPREAPFRYHAADLLEPVTYRDQARSAEFVFHFPSPTSYDEQGYRAVYVDAVTRLLTTLREANAPLRRFVLISSTSVYGQDDGAWVDERSATEPQRETAHAILEGEHLARTSGFPATVVRFSGIYGPGRDRLLRSVREGAARRTATDVWTNRIHRDDCAGFLAHLTRVATPAECYLATDDLPVLHDDVVTFLAAELGLAPPPVGEQPRSTIRSHTQGMNKRCSNRAMRATGYALRYPTFREGYRALISAPSLAREA